jgi:hypothetical protein
VAAALALAAVALALTDAWGAHWWSAGLAALAAVLLGAGGGRRQPALGSALAAAGAAAVSGVTVFAPPQPAATIGRLTARPTASWFGFGAWLVLCCAVLACLYLAVGARSGARPGGPGRRRGRSGTALAAVAVAVVCAVAGGVGAGWAGHARTRLRAGVLDQAAPAGRGSPPADAGSLHPAWSLPASGRASALAVPGWTLVLRLDRPSYGIPRRLTGVTASSGRAAWTLTAADGIGGVAVDAQRGRAVVLLGSAAAVLDLRDGHAVGSVRLHADGSVRLHADGSVQSHAGAGAVWTVAGAGPSGLTLVTGPALLVPTAAGSTLGPAPNGAGRAVAVDPATGRVVWTAPGGTEACSYDTASAPGSATWVVRFGAQCPGGALLFTLDSRGRTTPVPLPAAAGGCAQACPTALLRVAAHPARALLFLAAHGADGTWTVVAYDAARRPAWNRTVRQLLVDTTGPLVVPGVAGGIDAVQLPTGASPAPLVAVADGADVPARYPHSVAAAAAVGAATVSIDDHGDARLDVLGSGGLSGVPLPCVPVALSVGGRAVAVTCDGGTLLGLTSAASG